MDTASEPRANVAFGRFRVLPDRREVLADGQPLKLGGRAFDVLLALIEARGAVVSKRTLIAQIWPSQVVEENALQAQISTLRAAFRPERALIRTVSGRGYQFTAERFGPKPGGTYRRGRGRHAGPIRPTPNEHSGAGFRADRPG
jgi:DNA-binding winged helix-turn-helix (wHTH) protein